MRRLGIFGIGVAIAFAIAIASARAHEPVERLAPVALQGLDVTLGALREADGRLLVEAAKFRAVALRRTAPVAELDFTYLGPTEQAAPLASGELRRQLGLKLRAADGCNLVYVMWRIDPKPALVVSIKRNPGKRTHAQCGAGGYRNVKPERAVPLPKLEPGERHVLRAALAGDRLVVQVDGRAVWEGALGEEILAFDGPVGLRTDNARVAFQLRMP